MGLWAWARELDGLYLWALRTSDMHTTAIGRIVYNQITFVVSGDLYLPSTKFADVDN